MVQHLTDGEAKVIDQAVEAVDASSSLLAVNNKIISHDEVRAVVEPHFASAKQVRDLAPQLNISAPEHFKWAADFLLAIKKTAVDVDEKRKAIVGPWTESVRRVNALFRPTLTALDEAEKIVKEKIVEWSQGVDAQRAAEAALGNQVTLAPAEAEGVSIRTMFDFEIVNPDAVDRQFCSPDPAKIRAHIDNGGLMAIPGVRFFKKDVVYASRQGVKS